MNILYVVNTFPSLSESFVINELYELDRRGHDLTVFALQGSPDDITHDELDEMDLTLHYGTLPDLTSVPDLFSRRVFTRSFLSKLRYVDSPLVHAGWLHLGQQISDVVADRDIDHIHAHFAAPKHAAIAYAADYHRISCSVTAHAFELFANPNERRLRHVCNLVDHLIVPSEYNKRYLRENISTETPITIVPATTRVDKFPAAGEQSLEDRLLTVGRLVEKKGHEYAIRAVSQLVDNGRSVEYHIVGTGTRENALRELTANLGIEDHVTFLGTVSDERLRREYQESTIFVLPCVIATDGNRDAMPVVLKEAMAAETPCISTEISAIPELIEHHRDGLLVPPRDVEALTDAIGVLFDSPTGRQAMGERGRRTVQEKFDLKSSVDDLEAVFQRCVTGRNRPTASNSRR